MAIVMNSLGTSSLAGYPANLTNPSCEGTASQLASSSFNPYSDGTQTFLGTNSSYPLPFDSKVSTNDASRWCPWNLLVSPPDKPGDGVYPYPDDNIQRPAFSPCYSACSKWNKPSDCCVGKHDSPSTCSAGEYSHAAKKVCPDAYSYGKSRLFLRQTGPVLTLLQRLMIKLPLSSFPSAPDLRLSSAPAAARPTSWPPTQLGSRTSRQDTTRSTAIECLVCCSQ